MFRCFSRPLFARAASRNHDYVERKFAMGKTYRIALIPGDGTGPEVVREGTKVLDAAARTFGFKLEYTTFNFGGAHYLATGRFSGRRGQKLAGFHSIFLAP